MDYDSWKLASPYDGEPDYEAMAEFYEVGIGELTDGMIHRYDDEHAAVWADRHDH